MRRRRRRRKEKKEAEYQKRSWKETGKYREFIHPLFPPPFPPQTKKLHTHKKQQQIHRIAKTQPFPTPDDPSFLRLLFLTSQQSSRCLALLCFFLVIIINNLFHGILNIDLAGTYSTLLHQILPMIISPCHYSPSSLSHLLHPLSLLHPPKPLKTSPHPPPCPLLMRVCSAHDASIIKVG